MSSVNSNRRELKYKLGSIVEKLEPEEKGQCFYFGRSGDGRQRQRAAMSKTWCIYIENVRNIKKRIRCAPSFVLGPLACGGFLNHCSLAILPSERDDDHDSGGNNNNSNNTSTTTPTATIALFSLNEAQLRFRIRICTYSRPKIEEGFLLPGDPPPGNEIFTHETFHSFPVGNFEERWGNLISGSSEWAKILWPLEGVDGPQQFQIRVEGICDDLDSSSKIPVLPKYNKIKYPYLNVYVYISFTYHYTIRYRIIIYIIYKL